MSTSQHSTSRTIVNEDLDTQLVKITSVDSPQSRNKEKMATMPESARKTPSILIQASQAPIMEED